MGASGGGLFNYNGELLAITTFKTAGNTAFYYSMPVEIIKEMLANGKEIAVTEQPELPFWDAPTENQPFFMQIIGPMKTESWDVLKKITLEWLQEAPDEIEANYHHAFALYQLGEFVAAKNILKKVIEKNSKHTLSFLYLYKIAKSEDRVGDMSYYKSQVLQLDASLINQEDET